MMRKMAEPTNAAGGGIIIYSTVTAKPEDWMSYTYIIRLCLYVYVVTVLYQIHVTV